MMKSVRRQDQPVSLPEADRAKETTGMAEQHHLLGFKLQYAHEFPTRRIVAPSRIEALDKKLIIIRAAQMLPHSVEPGKRCLLPFGRLLVERRHVQRGVESMRRNRGMRTQQIGKMRMRLREKAIKGLSKKERANVNLVRTSKPLFVDESSARDSPRAQQHRP